MIRKLRLCNGREERYDLPINVSCAYILNLNIFADWVYTFSMDLSITRQMERKKCVFCSWILFYNWICFVWTVVGRHVNWNSVHCIHFEWFLRWLSKIAVVADFARRKKSDRKSIIIWRENVKGGEDVAGDGGGVAKRWGLTWERWGSRMGMVGK